MKCPRCGYVFNQEDLSTGFHKCKEHPNMIYECNHCKRKVHTMYRRQIEYNYWEKLRSVGRAIPIFPEYTYLCIDCMRKFHEEDALIGDDKILTTDSKEKLINNLIEENK